MKKILLLIVLLLLGAAAYYFWPHPATAPAAAANNDARALTGAEQAAFLPLVCGGASAGGDGYAHNCTSLPGYPSDDYGGAGTGLGITLTSVITGHISSATADEAYVSYAGDFEPHANDYGGGILFNKTGAGWKLAGWYPGGALEHCLVLVPDGQVKLLCLYSHTSQGINTDLDLVAVPAPESSGAGLNRITVLAASDTRATIGSSIICGLRKSADQDVLLSIDNIARSGTGYAAQVQYVAAADAEAACKAQNFANARVSKTTLTLAWDGSAMAITPKFNFAPSS